jgi:hypothetical protein
MATEIAVADPELEELMAALEAETGVKVAPSPAPAAKVVSAVATPALSEEDEMLLALEADLDPEPVKVDPAAALPDSAKAELLAALDAAEAPVHKQVTQADIDTAEAKLVTPVLETAGLTVVPVDPDDELAALEAELNAAPTTATTTTETTVRAVQPVAEERGLSFIPGEVLVDPATEIEEPAIGAAGALADAGLIKDGKPVFDPRTAFAVEDPLAGGQYYTDPTKFRVETSISDVDLDRCMIEQNGLRSFYGTNAARAEAQAGRMKVKFEVIEAKLYEEQRRLAAEDGEKITEKMLENRVKSTPMWLKAKLAVIDAQGISDINRALVESLKDRKDMLVQLGADRRGELQGATRVMASRDAATNERERATAAAQQAFQK